MKFTPEVIAALETLRKNAENDFERHRLDVLEKDLTNPPKPEVIDDKHQSFNGIVYHKLADKHYVKTTSIHRAVYQYYCGELPNNKVVHHIDINPDNNDISNLVVLTSREHGEIHRALQQQNVEKKICAYCGKEFEGEKNSLYRFCSANCAQSARYHSGIDDVIRHCAYCGKEFSSNKWDDAKFCSKACWCKFVGSRETRICPVCGKSFTVKKSKKQKTCSLSCGLKLSWQTTRKNKHFDE